MSNCQFQFWKAEMWTGMFQSCSTIWQVLLMKYLKTFPKNKAHNRCYPVKCLAILTSPMCKCAERCRHAPETYPGENRSNDIKLMNSHTSTIEVAINVQIQTGTTSLITFKVTQMRQLSNSLTETWLSSSPSIGLSHPETGGVNWGKAKRKTNEDRNV